ncbi:hypothetical protein NLJ89_g4279 [Agrocybe chaxingu]|uniref:Uncharacterized protein n=1 Tax=Agrocybe chaxingu TaxID=84603 RepID=A0A9W8K0T8_9AGAR|nr:hypothetical protein NLJ89_g4279 [Agrocybe chaxingu]
MSLPPIPELESAAKKIVWDAKAKGSLKDFTPRIIRQTIAKQFQLEEAILDEGKYKTAIKAATKAALDEEPPTADNEPKPTSKSDTPKKKRKSNGKLKAEEEGKSESAPTPVAKGKAKAAPKNSSNDDADGVPRKKRKTAKSKEDESEFDFDREEQEKSKKSVGQSGQKKDKNFKSAEHVPTSDMEQDDPDPISAADSSMTSKKPEFPQRKRAPDSKSKATPVKMKAAKAQAKPGSSKGKDLSKEDDAEKSDSELSVLIDEPPKKKRKSKSGEKASSFSGCNGRFAVFTLCNNIQESTKSKPKEKKGKKPAVVLSKDEETIKRLKSLVVACGTRKVWSKVFQGLDTPQQQIKKLKEMLTELGMTGRMTMEQAKAIKEKREFEQELQDVQQFAEAVAGRSSRSKAAKVDEPMSEEEDAKKSGDDEDDEEVAAPKRRPVRMNARKSIMAFLQDQSSDGE